MSVPISSRTKHTPVSFFNPEILIGPQPTSDPTFLADTGELTSPPVERQTCFRRKIQMREPGTVVFRLFVRVGACFYVNAALSSRSCPLSSRRSAGGRRARGQVTGLSPAGSLLITDGTVHYDNAGCDRISASDTRGDDERQTYDGGYSSATCCLPLSICRTRACTTRACTTSQDIGVQHEILFICSPYKLPL